LAGEAAFRQSHFADAVQEFSAFISRYPQSPLLERATLIQGESLYQLGRYADAQEVYRRFIDRYADSSLVREASYGLTWAQLKQGQVEEAQRGFERLQEQSAAPRYAEAMQYAAFVSAAQKSDDRAAKHQLQLLSQNFPESPLVAAAWGELAWLRFDGQAYAEALNLYRHLVQSPRTPRLARDVAQFMVGESLYQLSRYAQATAALRNVRSDADAALREKVAFRLGLALYYQRLYQQASQVLQAFVVSYASSPYRDEAVYWLAEAHFHQGDYQAALQTSKRLPRDSRLYPYALHSQGWSYLRLQQWSSAIHAFQQIIEADPQSAVAADALYRMAESYRQLGQSETAQHTYERYLSLYPKGPQAAASELQLTLLTDQRDNVDTKIADLERIQQLYPGTEAAIEAQLRLGTILFQQNRFAEARQSFEAFATAHPNHAKTATVRLRLADTFYNEKQFHDSLIAYRKVILLHPNSDEVADARYGVVLSHYRLGEYPQFLNESQNFIRDYPDHALSESVLLQMAEYFQEQKRPEEAIDTYTYMARAYADKPLAAKARLRLGELYLSTDQPDQAIAVFEQILQNGQADDLKPDALYGQAQAYEARGDSDAPQRYARVAEAYPESPLAARSLHQAGRLSQNNGAYAQALGYFERVVLSYPHDPLRYDSWLQWGVVLLDLKQPERALDVLQEAQQTLDQHIAAQAQWHIGRAHTQAGSLQQGTNAYLRVAYLYPNEKGLVSEALRQAARNYVSLGKCPEALTVYDKLLKQTASVHLQQVIQQELAGSGCQS
jgi:TolA-binding protein